MKYQKSFKVTDYVVPTSNLFFHTTFYGEIRNDAYEGLQITMMGFQNKLSALDWWLYVVFGQFYLAKEPANQKSLYELMYPNKEYKKLKTEERTIFKRIIHDRVTSWNTMIFQYRYYGYTFSKMVEIYENNGTYHIKSMAFYDAAQIHGANKCHLTRFPIRLMRFTTNGKLGTEYCHPKIFFLLQPLIAIKAKAYLLMRIRIACNRSNRKMKKVILKSNLYKAVSTNINEKWLLGFMRECSKEGLIRNLKMNSLKIEWK